MKKAPYIISLVSVAALASCATEVPSRSAAQTAASVEPPVVSVPVPTYAQVSELLDRRCASCHNREGAAGAGDLDLEPDASYAMLMRQSTQAPLLLVKPGDPEMSYLFAKLTAQQGKVGGWGEQMPAGQGSLPPAELAVIREWIIAGAKK